MIAPCCEEEEGSAKAERERALIRGRSSRISSASTFAFLTFLVGSAAGFVTESPAASFFFPIYFLENQD